MLSPGLFFDSLTPIGIPFQKEKEIRNPFREFPTGMLTGRRVGMPCSELPRVVCRGTRIGCWPRSVGLCRTSGTAGDRGAAR